MARLHSGEPRSSSESQSTDRSLHSMSCPAFAQHNSILFPKANDHLKPRHAPEFFHDLNLDQVVRTITAACHDYDLLPVFHIPLNDLDEITYRQEVMHDLEIPVLFEAVTSFSQQMRLMREHLSRVGSGLYKHEVQRWFLDAVHVYCRALERFWRSMSEVVLCSRGMVTFRAALTQYMEGASFRRLAFQATALTADFSSLHYSLLIQEGKFTVCRYNGETDYSAAVERTFEKFRRGAVSQYLAELPKGTGMNHVQAAVLDRVALLHPRIFDALDHFCTEWTNFRDELIVRFDREIQFYIACLKYVRRFRDAGLNFCYPKLSTSSKEIVCRDTFDLALAEKCINEKIAVITNDIVLREPERIFVVSGPNQGGKTTFARTFGQLHYLGCLGCPVPGTQAQLFVFDRLFTHFEREEDITNLRGKLHDDLIRIRRILDEATPRSIVIMNELFSSTTLKDAIFLSQRIMARMSQIDLLGVWVTFLTELASFNEKTVSVVSTVNPNDPAIRTFQLRRAPAEGTAYALAIAEKHHVTYGSLLERIRP